MSRSDRDHATDIVGYGGDIATLAVEIGRMRYDAQVFLLRTLAEEISRQAAADRGRGRPRLAESLAQASADIDRAAISLHAAWRHCRRHVPHELESRPEIPLPERRR